MKRTRVRIEKPVKIPGTPDLMAPDARDVTARLRTMPSGPWHLRALTQFDGFEVPAERAEIVEKDDGLWVTGTFVNRTEPGLTVEALALDVE